MGPSAVWTYFTKTCQGAKVKCNQCNQELCFNKSTSTLAYHLRVIHKIEIPKQVPKVPKRGIKRRRESSAEAETISDSSDVDDVENNQVNQPESSTESSNFTLRNSSKTASISFSGPMDKCISNATSFSVGGIRDISVMDALLFMISKDNMPLSTTERSGFRLFVKKLQPLWNIPSEPTVTKKLQMKYEFLRGCVMQKISKADSVCLTTDIWTHKHTMRSYLGITAHYREGVELRSIEIGAKLIEDRKNIPNLRKALRQVCDDWGITNDQISAVISDGGANIKGAIRQEFGNEKHLLCLAHLINGIGQSAIGLNDYTVSSMMEEDSFENLEIDQEGDEFREPEDNRQNLKFLIKKLKSIVRFFRSSEVATTELKKLQEKSGKSPHHCLILIQEVRTRWNSCFEMIERFLLLADHVSRVLIQLKLDKNTKSKVPNMLSGDALETLNEVQNLLKPLYQVTMEVVSEKQVTISKIIPLINALKSKTNEMMACTPIGFNLKHSLITLIDTKFNGIEKVRIYAAATMLDPRFKKGGFTDPLAVSNCISYIAKLVVNEIGNRRTEVESIEEINDLQANENNDDLWSNFDSSARNDDSGAYQDVSEGFPIELKHFIRIPAIPRKLTSNPLSAWEGLKNEFAHVHKIALKFLPIMATSVPCERLFSHAGLIANQLRNKLSGKHLDQLVFLRSIDPDMWFDEN